MPVASDDQPREFRFGDCCVSLASREIHRAGKPVAVEPKAFDLLVYLIERHDRAVTKDELQDAIWPGVIVTEGALTRCVMKARRATGIDNAISTVRNHGYRFTAELEAGSGSESVATSTARNKPSIVVLPFVTIGNASEDDYFADGITDDIITELSRFRSLFVIARPSAFSYKGRNARASEVASELGVGYVVDGTLQRAGGRVRINVRLVDAETDSQIWAERYDREVEDIFLVQEELAATIAATVGGRVEVTRGRQRLDQAEFESYDCLLKAQALYYEYRPDSNAEARRLLEQSLEIQADNARALAILAAVHSMDSWSYWVEDYQAAQQASLKYGKRSIELDDSDSLAQALFAEILHDCGHADLSDHHFRRAIEINPNDIAARALYASMLASLDRVEEALEHLAAAELLDPFGLDWIPVIGASVMNCAGRYEDALGYVGRMTTPPSESLIIKLAALGRLGKTDQSEKILSALFKQARDEMPNFPGTRLQEWDDFIRRIYRGQRDDLYTEFIESLKLAGWN